MWSALWWMFWDPWPSASVLPPLARTSVRQVGVRELKMVGDRQVVPAETRKVELA